MVGSDSWFRNFNHIGKYFPFQTNKYYTDWNNCPMAYERMKG